jgi:hypothetical protein
MADDDHPDLHDIETPFDRRVASLIDAETTPFELVASLKERDLPMPEVDRKSRSPYPLAALVRVYLFHELSGNAIDAILDRLNENPDEAATFGFEDIPDRYGAGDVPDQSRLSRGKDGDRFDPAEYERIERRAERILELVHERGNPMNLRSLEAEDKQEASSPTKHRHAKTKRNEAAEDAAEMLAAIYDYSRGDNTTYEMETFLRVLAEMSVEDKTARGACRDDDDPIECENNKPDGDTFRLHPNNLHPTDIVRMHDGVIELVSEKIKKFVEFDRPVKIGVDGTEIEIPGDPEKTDPAVEEIGEMFRELPDDATGQFVHGVQDEDSDAKCYKFITLNIVGQHFRIPLVVRPIPKGVPREVLVRELYWRAQEIVSIEEAYLDAEFYSAGVLWSLNESPSQYVVSAPKRDRLKRFEKRMDEEVAVKRDHGVFGPVEGLGKAYAKTNIVAMPSNRNPDKTVMFATNKDVRDEIGPDCRRAVQAVEGYNKRGEHEKCYEMVKKFLAPTQSKSLRLHLLYFCFACVAYAMWKLADFRAKKDLGIPLEDEEGRTTDSVVEFEEFLETLEEYLGIGSDFLHEPG